MKISYGIKNEDYTQYMISQYKMDIILRHRQLKIWEEVCKTFTIKPSLAEEVKRTILEGKFYEFIDEKKSK